MDTYTIERREIDRLEARTGADIATEALRRAQDLAARHAEHYPGDPIFAALNIYRMLGDELVEAHLAKSRHGR